MQKRRAALNDYERFKVMLAKIKVSFSDKNLYSSAVNQSPIVQFRGEGRHCEARAGLGKGASDF